MTAVNADANKPTILARKINNGIPRNTNKTEHKNIDWWLYQLNTL